MSTRPVATELKVERGLPVSVTTCDAIARMCDADLRHRPGSAGARARRLIQRTIACPPASRRGAA